MKEEFYTAEVEDDKAQTQAGLKLAAHQDKDPVDADSYPAPICLMLRFIITRYMENARNRQQIHQ